MSLFAGIKFTSDKAKALENEAREVKEVEQQAAPAPAEAQAQAQPVPQPPPSPPRKPAPTKAPAELLQFAPRLNKPKAKPATVYAAAPVPADAPVLVVPPPAPKPDIERGPTTARGPKRIHPDGPKRRKKKKAKRQVVYTFQPDEEYDPSRPNDLGEYQLYRAQLVAERRKGRESSSEYSESSDEAPRRDAPRSFGPPKLWAPPPSLAPQRIVEEPEAQVRAESGDDAYARRAAMTAASGDDAYARRLAMSQQPAKQPPPGLPPPPFPPPQFQPPVARPTPNFPPPSLPLPPPGIGRPPVPPAPPLPLPPPGIGRPPLPPLPPPGIGRPALPPSEPPVDPEFQRRVDEKKREVAAKLAAMTGTPVPDPTTKEDKSDQSGTFAERLMRKWGHKEGSGIGARGDGIVHALTTEHVVPHKAMSKRAAAKARAAAANAKQKAWSQAASTRGRIVDASAEDRAAAERERVGDASRIVVLSGLVDGEDGIDESLSDDIGTECSKFGIVERVVLHVVEPPPADAREMLRVFVVFSGMAGAWRATRELDGRMFGGHRIRARYFEETRFMAGERDGEL